MHVDDAFGNRESESKPAKLPRDIASALFEGVENFLERLRIDADTAVGYFNDDVMRRIVARGDFQSTSFGVN